MKSVLISHYIVLIRSLSHLAIKVCSVVFSLSIILQVDPLWAEQGPSDDKWCCSCERE